jgi:hypothetical protein
MWLPLLPHEALAAFETNPSRAPLKIEPKRSQSRRRGVALANLTIDKDQHFAFSFCEAVVFTESRRDNAFGYRFSEHKGASDAVDGPKVAPRIPNEANLRNRNLCQTTHRRQEK